MHATGNSEDVPDGLYSRLITSPPSHLTTARSNAVGPRFLDDINAGLDRALAEQVGAVILSAAARASFPAALT